MRNFVIKSSLGEEKSDDPNSITGELVRLIKSIPDEEVTLTLRNKNKCEETPFQGSPARLLHLFEKMVSVVFGGAILRKSPPPEEEVLAMIDAIVGE